MRRCRAALTALTVVLMSVLVAGPASAGGPTSVLIVEPDTRVATSRLYTDAEYGALASLVGVNDESGLVGEVDKTGREHQMGSMVTLTWLIHDVTVWRADRIFLEAAGGPWISTQLVRNDVGHVSNSPVTWHTAADGPELTALLGRMGFGPEAEAAAGSAPRDSSLTCTTGGAGQRGGCDPGGDGTAAATGKAVAPAPQPAQETSRPASAAPTWGGWAWGLAGLALGLAHALAAPRVLSRARPSAPDDGLPWTPADELSWSGSRRG